MRKLKIGNFHFVGHALHMRVCVCEYPSQIQLFEWCETRDAIALTQSYRLSSFGILMLSDVIVPWPMASTSNEKQNKNTKL